MKEIKKKKKEKKKFNKKIINKIKILLLIFEPKLRL